MICDSWLPCQATGDLPGGSVIRRAFGSRGGVGAPELLGMLGIGLIVRGDHDGGNGDLGELIERRERSRTWQRLERIGQRIQVLVLRQPLRREHV